ncbi:MAG: macro domain-containing protein [Lachnospiraceae bacterium]|nr:macro domain-containing protein [Lachnospiraceae bacterium]
MPFQIVRNDITKMQVDAIVNTACSETGYGDGTDRAVYEAAGCEELLKKRLEAGRILPGTSVVTEGLDLPASYIIHTVGTPWQGGGYGEEEVIRRCYRSVFELVKEKGFESLAIPLLASGNYGFPKVVALRIAISEIETFMSENELDLYLVVFDESSYGISSELYGDIDSYIDDNYVEKKAAQEYEYVRASVQGGKKRAASLLSGGFLRKSMRKSSGAFFGAGAGKSAGPWDGAIYDKGAGKEDRAYYDQNAGEEDGVCAENSPGEEDGVCAENSPGEESSVCYDRNTGEESGNEAYYCSDVQMMGAGSIEPASDKRSLEDVIKNLDKTFMELVFYFADIKGMTDVEVQKKANLDRKAFSKLKCGTTRNPSKSTALALCIALELNLDDAKDLLSRAGFALSPCSKQDLIVKYFIEREAYDIYEINLALFEHGEALLGCAAG